MKNFEDERREIRATHRIKDVLRSYGIKVRRDGMCRCPSPDHVDKTPSCKVYPHKDGYDYFHCHGCGVQGDVMQLVQTVERVKHPEACNILKGRQPSKPAVRAVAPEKPLLQLLEVFDHKLLPPSGNIREHMSQQQQPRAIKRDGTPGMSWPEANATVYPYEDYLGRCIGFVLVRTWTTTARDGKKKRAKDVKPFRRTVDGRWCHAGWEGKAPLFNRRDLELDRDKEVLVVEGEKCAVLAKGVWEHRYVVITWQGGAGRARYADWSVLNGRRVIFWPDNDPGGHDALNDCYHGCKPASFQRVLVPPGKKAGWDIADAYEENGRSAEAVHDWMLANLERVIEQGPEPEETKAPAPYADFDALPDHFRLTKSWLPPGEYLVPTSKGERDRKEPINAAQYLLHHPWFKDRCVYDLFEHKVLVDGREVNDGIVLDLQLELNNRVGMVIETKALGRTVSAVAGKNRVNQLADYLQSLQWDGVHRLKPGGTLVGEQGLLPNYANVEPDEYTCNIAFRWFMGLVRRIILPDGYKHDFILVLEGQQGHRKTSFLQALAKVGRWDLFTELQSALGRDKDDMMKFHGKALVELSEMTAHRRSDQDAFKGFVDRIVDKFRMPYTATSVEFPRRCVFAGTTNRLSNYLSDPTGSRRLWPATVRGKIDIERLKVDVEQIWAEAVHYAMLHDGVDFVHPNWLQGREEEIHASMVTDREEMDPWQDLLMSYLDSISWPNTVPRAWPLDHITKLHQEKQTKIAFSRVQDAMRKLGYEFKRNSPNKANNYNRDRLFVKVEEFR